MKALNVIAEATSVAPHPIADIGSNRMSSMPKAHLVRRNGKLSVFRSGYDLATLGIRQTQNSASARCWMISIGFPLIHSIYSLKIPKQQGKRNFKLM